MLNYQDIGFFFFSLAAASSLKYVVIQITQHYHQTEYKYYIKIVKCWETLLLFFILQVSNLITEVQ